MNEWQYKIDLIVQWHDNYNMIDFIVCNDTIIIIYFFGFSSQYYNLGEIKLKGSASANVE